MHKIYKVTQNYRKNSKKSKSNHQQNNFDKIYEKLRVEFHKLKNYKMERF